MDPVQYCVELPMLKLKKPDINRGHVGGNSDCALEGKQKGEKKNQNPSPKLQQRNSM